MICRVIDDFVPIDLMMVHKSKEAIEGMVPAWFFFSFGTGFFPSARVFSDF